MTIRCKALSRKNCDLESNYLGARLKQAEREEVYHAVCELVQNRLNKARNV